MEIGLRVQNMIITIPGPIINMKGMRGRGRGHDGFMSTRIFALLKRNLDIHMSWVQP